MHDNEIVNIALMYVMIDHLNTLLVDYDSLSSVDLSIILHACAHAG